MTNDGIHSVLAKGPFLKENVQVVWDNNPFFYPVEFLNEIEKYWQKIKAPHIFNGELIRLNKVRSTDIKLQLDLSLSNYATLLFSNAHVKRIVNKWGNQYLSNALGISAVVVSSDEKIVLMKRSSNVGEFPNCLDVFGGHIDKPEIGFKPDVYASMEKELAEELALANADFDLDVLALVQANVNQKPELVFSAFVEKNFKQIVKDAEKADDRFEWETVTGISVAELGSFLETERMNLSPSAFGSLEMFLILKQEAHFGTRE